MIQGTSGSELRNSSRSLAKTIAEELETSDFDQVPLTSDVRRECFRILRKEFLTVVTKILKQNVTKIISKHKLGEIEM